MNMEKTNPLQLCISSDSRQSKQEKKHSFASQTLLPESSGKQDYLGGFVVTAGIGAEELARKYEAEQNDYNALMVKALADRLAEAFAEHMHEKVRKELWGYQPEEAFGNEELIKEAYQGIRPAPGYPACPDHSEKEILFELLNARQNIGVELTESYAMTPAATVSGFYFAHPDSKYFRSEKSQQSKSATWQGARISRSTSSLAYWRPT